MKRLLVFSFLILLFSSSLAQESILVQENLVNSKKYFSQGIALSKSDVVNLMKDYPRLQEEFIKGNEKLKIGMWCMILGGSISVTSIAWIYSYPDFLGKELFVPIGIAAGLPFFLIGQQFRVSGRSKIDFAISTFNDSQFDLRRKKIELNIGFSSNGMGLIFRF